MWGSSVASAQPAHWSIPLSIRARSSAALLLGTTAALVPTVRAAAEPTPVPVSIDGSGDQTTDLGPLTSTEPTRALSRCGGASSSYTYQDDILGWTLNVFKHANTTGACTDTHVITHV